MSKERIAEIISTYGKNDFYDQATGLIYKFSDMKYHLFYNKTFIPVLDRISNDIKEVIELEGNYEALA